MRIAEEFGNQAILLGNSTHSTAPNQAVKIIQKEGRCGSHFAKAWERDRELGMSTERVGAEVKFSQAQPQHIVRELETGGTGRNHLSLGNKDVLEGRIPIRVASGSKGWENVHSFTQQIFIEELLLARHCARSFC